MAQQDSRSVDNSISVQMRRRPFLFILLALGMLFVASYTSRLAEYRRLQVEKVTIETQIVDAEARGRELVAELEYVKSPEYAEEIAISELRMARAGDTVLTIVDPPESSGSIMPALDASQTNAQGDTGLVPGSAERGQPAWRQWISLFLPEED